MARSSLDSCYCGSGQTAPARKDARGIFLTYACDHCWKQKRHDYRAEVLDDPDYSHDEPIDGEVV